MPLAALYTVECRFSNMHAPYTKALKVLERQAYRNNAVDVMWVCKAALINPEDTGNDIDLAFCVKNALSHAIKAIVTNARKAEPDSNDKQRAGEEAVHLCWAMLNEDIRRINPDSRPIVPLWLDKVPNQQALDFLLAYFKDGEVETGWKFFLEWLRLYYQSEKRNWVSNRDYVVREIDPSYWRENASEALRKMEYFEPYFNPSRPQV